MRALEAKTKSQRGASILLALALVLVCTMVAAVVLVAAAANAGKGLSSQEQTRAYYTVSSAAQLLARDVEVNGPTANVGYSYKSYACQTEHPSYVHSDAHVPSDVDVIFTLDNNPLFSDPTPFMQILEEGARSIQPGVEGSVFERDFVIRAEGFDPVDAHFSMDSTYDARVVLSVAPGAESFGYAMTVSIPALREEPVETNVTDAAGDVHFDGWAWNEGGDEYSWLDENKTPVNPTTGNHEPDSNTYGHSTPQNYAVTTTTVSTQISWGKANFSKGAAE